MAICTKSVLFIMMQAGFAFSLSLSKEVIPKCRNSIFLSSLHVCYVFLSIRTG